MGWTHLRRPRACRSICRAAWPIRLLAGRFDVASFPPSNSFAAPSSTIVSDACVACRGPVLSVKLHFRVPPQRGAPRGPRRRFANQRRPHANPAGRDARHSTRLGTAADRLLDPKRRRRRRAPDRRSGNSRRLAKPSKFVEIWDLGERWCEWTGLPFVFAMWIARAGVDVGEVRRGSQRRP